MHRGPEPEVQGRYWRHARTLRICELVAADRDDMVAKGLSWALRELAERDRDAVVDFIERHHEMLPSRVLREVSNNLQTGLKTPRKHSSATG